MEMFNADGSRGAMCGNGIRCLGKYVYDKRLTRKTCLAIDTPAGVRRLELHLKGGLVEGVTVEMGEPKVGVPLELETGEGRRAVIPVDMGNPHGVILTQQPQAFPLERVGPLLQADPAFPQGVNVEAAAPVPEGLELRVWERGSGETLACGTGACAAFAALVKRGLCPRSARARLPGGWLELSWPETGAGIRMTGPARTVFEGEIPD